MSLDLLNPELVDLFDATNDERKLPSAVVELFDNYVHDSLAGFYLKKSTELTIRVLRTNGYLRYRGVFKIRGAESAPACAVQPAETA